MSLIATLKERLTTRQAARVIDARTSYRRIIEAIADEQEPALEDVEQALQEADKSPDDLQADVDLLIERRRLAAQLAERRDVERELQRHQNAMDAETEAFEKLRAESIDRRNTIEKHLQQCQSKLQMIDAAAKQLETSCRDEALLQEEKRLIARRVELAGRQREIKEDLWGNGRVGTFTDVVTDSSGSRLITLEAKVNQLRNGTRGERDPELPAARRRLESFRRNTIDPLTAEYQDLQRQIDENNARLETIRLQKREP